MDLRDDADVGTQAQIICIGDELLTGGTVDTNSGEIGRFLWGLGIDVERALSVADSIPAVVRALRSLEGIDLCVMTGGLGPTGDDLTSAAVAMAAGVRCERSEAAMAAVAGALARRGHELDAIQARQADVPAGARLIENSQGIAPGFSLEIGGSLVIVLPGVPAEMREMLAGPVATLLRSRWPSLPPRQVKQLRVFGLREATVAARVETLLETLEAPELHNIGVHYRALGPEIEITVDTNAISAAMAEVLLQGLRDALGTAFVGDGSAGLAARVASTLSAHGLLLATAESCTGGRVAAAMTAIAGVSACFHGGVVAYHNGIKEKILGIPAKVLETHGAVSEPVARGMAAGVRAAFEGHADLGVGITGIAGPGGGSAEKPVGTVDIAVSDAMACEYRRFHFYGDRPTIQRAATSWALWMVLQRLRERGLSAADLVD